MGGATRSANNTWVGLRGGGAGRFYSSGVHEAEVRVVAARSVIGGSRHGWSCAREATVGDASAG